VYNIEIDLNKFWSRITHTQYSDYAVGLTVWGFKSLQQSEVSLFSKTSRMALGDPPSLLVNGLGEGGWHTGWGVRLTTLHL